MSEENKLVPLVHLEQDEIIMVFVSLCIENCAEKEGVSPRSMYQRMEKVGLIKNYLINCYDTLHVESTQSVTNLVLETLKRKEAAV